MKRGVIDTLRRGLDNTIANWPLLLLRFAEAFLFIVIAFAAAVAVVVPIVVSLGLSVDLLRTPDGIEDLMGVLAARWLLLVYIFGIVSLVILVFVAIHSFLEAGCARVYVDAERMAGPETSGPRRRFAVFSIQKWLAGATDGWWPVFWIYNLAWGVAALILLIPLLPTLVLMLVFRETPGALIASGCLGIALTMMLLFFVSIVVVIWSNRAIVGWALTRGSASDALSSAWASVKQDFGRLLLAAVCLFVISMAGSSFFAGFSFLSGIFGSISDSGMFEVITIPVRLAASIVSTAFSTVMSGWFLATFAAFAVEKKR